MYDKKVFKYFYTFEYMYKHLGIKYLNNYIKKKKLLFYSLFSSIIYFLKQFKFINNYGLI